MPEPRPLQRGAPKPTSARGQGGRGRLVEREVDIGAHGGDEAFFSWGVCTCEGKGQSSKGDEVHDFIAPIGRWGRLILRDLVSLGVDVTVAAPSAETRSRALEEGAIAACSSHNALPGMDGYVVAAPTVLHL